MEVPTCSPPPTMAGVSGDHAATGIPYSVRMQRAYELSSLLQKYGLNFETVNRDINMPIGPQSLPPTLKASYELAPYKTSLVIKKRDFHEDSEAFRENITPRFVFGDRCCVTLNECFRKVGHWIGIGEKKEVLHCVDCLAGTAPGTTNTFHQDNICMRDGSFHGEWMAGNVVVLPITSSTDFRPPNRLVDITKHNIRCAPRERINIYDWIPHTQAESSTSPGYLYLVIFFNQRKECITLWKHSDGHCYDVPVEDGVLTFMNNHPLLVSFASARVRQKLHNADRWNPLCRQQTAEIQGALKDFDELVESWTSLDIVETRAEFNTQMNGPRTVYPPPPTRNGKKKEGPVRNNTRSIAARDAKAAAELQEFMDRPARMTRSQSTSNLNQAAAAQTPVLKRKKSAKKIKKNLKRAADEGEEEGINNAVASTSQTKAAPMRKAKRTRK